MTPDTRLTMPPHVATTLEHLAELHPGARIETEIRWFIRAYDDKNLCIDVRNLAHGED